VLAVDGNTLYLAGGLAFEWSKGTRVYPLARGNVKTPQLSSVSDMVANATIVFTEGIFSESQT
jgi:hypothetical protein